jgi:hypothetical protein
MSSFADRRRFLLKVIDDMAKEEVLHALPECVRPEVMTELVRSPALTLDQVEEDDDDELLRQRRLAAEAVCQYVSDVGFLHVRPIHESLLAAVEQLRMIDDEVVRRNLVADQSPQS